MHNLIAHIERVVAKADSLSSRTTKKGVRLIGNVPHVAPEAYFHVLFPGLSGREIVRLEKAINRPVCEPYRTFLSHFNGATFFAYELALFGLRFDYSREGDAAWQPFHMDIPNVSERPPNLEALDVVVGFYQDDGSLVYLRAADSTAVRCDGETGRRLNQWSSFEDFLSTELDRLAGLFGSDGRRLHTKRGVLPSADA